MQDYASLAAGVAMAKWNVFLMPPMKKIATLAPQVTSHVMTEIVSLKGGFATGEMIVQTRVTKMVSSICNYTRTKMDH